MWLTAIALDVANTTILTYTLRRQQLIPGFPEMHAPVHAAPVAPPDPRAVLTKALLNAGNGLGLSQQQLAEIVGRERTAFSRGLDPDSKAGELALLLIRCYRSLYALVGGDAAAIRHWMHTRNRDTGGIPAEQVRSVQGPVMAVESPPPEPRCIGPGAVEPALTSAPATE